MRVGLALLLSVVVLFGGVATTAAAAPCNPRPPVVLRVVAEPEHPEWLRVFVRASTNDGLSYNEIRSIRFARISGGRVYARGELSAEPFAITLPSSTQSVPVDLIRTGQGRAQVFLTIVDLCGEWPTFVSTAR